MAEETGFRVTQAVIYEAVIQLKTEMAILNDKIPAEIAKTDREIADHEKRLRNLEQFRWTVVGLAMASGGLGAMLGNVLMN
jgi:hypothetical protein